MEACPSGAMLFGGVCLALGGVWAAAEEEKRESRRGKARRRVWRQRPTTTTCCFFVLPLGQAPQAADYSFWLAGCLVSKLSSVSARDAFAG